MNHTGSSNPPTAPRLWFLDWLRIAAFGLLIPYHVGMVYVRWPYHFKATPPLSALEPWMLASNSWRMSLLFVISGAATSLMLRHAVVATVALPAPSGAWLKRRLGRLLLPLLAGVVAIVPPQAYVQVVQQNGYQGSFADFLLLYYSHYRGFQDSTGHMLMLPTWNHLWFLAYLAVYTVLVWVLLRQFPNALDKAARWADQNTHPVVLLVAPVLVLIATRLMLHRRFPETHALVDDWWLHAQYLPMFVVGAAAARATTLWARFEALRIPALTLAFVAWIVVVFDHRNHLASPYPAIAFGVLQWCAIAAALGFARRHWNYDHRWRARLVGAVFPLYVVHQTVILCSRTLL